MLSTQTIRCADIGTDTEEWELEPFSTPVEEPTYAPAEEPDRELVPA